MAWEPNESRPRITPDSRRAGLLTLLVGGLLIAGLLTALVPTEQRFGDSGKLACGTPLSAAFTSERAYVAAYYQQQAPPPGSPGNPADVGSAPQSLRTAAAACASSGRIRTSIGGAVAVLALLGCAAALVTARRSRPQRDD
jgi:hypothetical protein